MGGGVAPIVHVTVYKVFVRVRVNDGHVPNITTNPAINEKTVE